MRTAFVDVLFEEAQRDPSIALLTGDLGFGVLERFSEKLPEQFLNCGVAEQSMIGVAAGMAASGYKVFVYSIANFPTLRCLEQIRNDVAYHRLNVTIVSVGAGFAYGTLGYSHFGLEDLAVMRAIPGMDIICPSDALEVEQIVRDRLLGITRPAYLRLGKAGEPRFHDRKPAFSRGEAICIREGSEATIAACGSVLGVALEARELLADLGHSVAVLSVPYVRPISSDCVEAALGAGLVTVEEHSSTGGLGSAVLDAVIARGGVPKMRVIGAPPEIPRQIGTQSYLREMAGITVEAVVNATRDLLHEGKV